MNGAVLAGFELSWIFYRFGFFRLSILSIFRLSIWVFPFIDFIDFRLSIWVFSFIDFIDFRLSISVFSFIDFIDFRLSFSIFKSIMHFQCNIPESRFQVLVSGDRSIVSSSDFTSIFFRDFTKVNEFSKFLQIVPES